MPGGSLTEGGSLMPVYTGTMMLKTGLLEQFREVPTPNATNATGTWNLTLQQKNPHTEDHSIDKLRQYSSISCHTVDNPNNTFNSFCSHSFSSSTQVLFIVISGPSRDHTEFISNYFRHQLRNSKLASPSTLRPFTDSCNYTALH
jgi:hypothetical protein